MPYKGILVKIPGNVMKSLSISEYLDSNKRNPSKYQVPLSNFGFLYFNE